MKADHLAAAKHRLRLLGRARDKILHQDLIGECVGAEIVKRGVEIAEVTLLEKSGGRHDWRRDS